MIASEHLDTFQVDLSFDDPHILDLVMAAEFSFWEDYEGIEACARALFERFSDESSGARSVTGPLRRAYNALQEANRVAAFDREDEDALTQLRLREQALVAELLTFYGDRAVWVVLQVDDTRSSDRAWFLLPRKELARLDLPLHRGEA